MRFNIYFKTNNDSNPVTFDCEGFELNGDFIGLLNQSKKVSKFGTLRSGDVSAILPETPLDLSKLEQTLTFQVYLKGRSKPLEIVAHIFDLSSESTVQFFWLTPIVPGMVVESGTRKSASGDHLQYLIPNIYIRPSEVIAILPAEGLHPSNFGL